MEFSIGGLPECTLRISLRSLEGGSSSSSSSHSRSRNTLKSLVRAFSHCGSGSASGSGSSDNYSSSISKITVVMNAEWSFLIWVAVVAGHSREGVRIPVRIFFTGRLRYLP